MGTERQEEGTRTKKHRRKWSPSYTQEDGQFKIKQEIIKSPDSDTDSLLFTANRAGTVVSQLLLLLFSHIQKPCVTLTVEQQQ